MTGPAAPRMMILCTSFEMTRHTSNNADVSGGRGGHAEVLVARGTAAYDAPASAGPSLDVYAGSTRILDKSEFAISQSMWEHLQPGRYYARVVDLATLEPLRGWSWQKN